MKIFCSIFILFLLLFFSAVRGQRPERPTGTGRDGVVREKPAIREYNPEAPIKYRPPENPVYSPPAEEVMEPEPVPGRCGGVVNDPTPSPSIHIVSSYSERMKLEGINYFAQGEYYVAIFKFSSAIAADSHDYDLYLLRGSANIKVSNYIEATSDLDFYVSKIPEDPDGYYYRGIAKYYYFKKDEAYDDLVFAERLGSNKAAIFLKRFYVL